MYYLFSNLDLTASNDVVHDLCVDSVNKVANEIKNDKIKLEVKPWFWNISAFFQSALHGVTFLINGYVLILFLSINIA